MYRKNDFDLKASSIVVAGPAARWQPARRTKIAAAAWITHMIRFAIVGIFSRNLHWLARGVYIIESFPLSFPYIALPITI